MRATLTPAAAAALSLERMAKNLRPVTPRLKLTTKSPARATGIIEKTVKLEIYQETSGEIKKIHMLDLNIITKGKNVIELNKKLSNTLPNSKIIVKFINFPEKNNLNLSNLEFYKSNEIDLSKHIIYERSDSCYLISKND